VADHRGAPGRPLDEMPGSAVTRVAVRKKGGGMAETQTSIILVTDLVGSTATRSEVGEDAAENLRRRHDAMLTETVRQHDGVLVKSLGDGILARFAGAATAVACACAMQQRVDGRFDIRIGLSAGDVTLEDHDCFGTPVIEASRLCDRAEGGQILVADLILTLARGRGGHVFESIGTLELKGLAGPVPTSQVVWDQSRYNRVRFPDRLRVGGRPFIGRENVLEDLARRWRTVEEGATQVVLISGEPGIGKTRLMSETAAMAYGAGGTVLYGSCTSDGPLAHRLFTQALTPLVADLPNHVTEAHVERCRGVLAELVPIMASRVLGLEPAEVTNEEPLSVIHDAVVDLLRRASTLAPVMLILEDLHCADDDTAALFSRLARTRDLGAVLVVGTYRPANDYVHRNQPFNAALADLRPADGIERVRLRGLGLDDVIGLMSAAEGRELDQRRRELAAVVHRQTDGNPFLIDDALRRLTDSGATFHLDRSTRVGLGTVGGMSIVGAGMIVGTVVVGDWSGAVLNSFIAAAALLAGAGLWLLLQMNSSVSVGPSGLGIRTGGGLRVVKVPWDDIDAIGWRPPSRWMGGPGALFVEISDGRKLTNPVIKDPSPEFVQTLYDVCQLHNISDVALRAKLPKMRRLGG
jgi:class 3 adenylate cyclase